MAINDLKKLMLKLVQVEENEKSVRVPPETQMKKLKIKKIVVWEHNESIRKKKMLKNVVETEKKNMWNGKKKWEHNEMIIKKKDVEKMTETEKKKMWNGKKNESIMVYVFCF